jgi:hypothetical protein
VSRAQLIASRTLWRRRLKYRQKKVDVVRGMAKSGEGADTKGVVTAEEAAHIKKWEKLRDEAKEMVARRDRQLAATGPVRVRAFRVAQSLIGVMEQGGNNMGAMVSKIIRENGGGGPEPWCGDFMAYCYRHAGSKRVTRSWAAVRLLRGVLGISATSKPQKGDLVRFMFDHVGMFEKDNGNGTITTIEGNTGRSGAVSDSSTGGDGVYRKVRAKGLVRDYLRVNG